MFERVWCLEVTMYRITLGFFCFLTASLFVIAQAEHRASLTRQISSGVARETSLNTYKNPIPLQTPRKRRPYDPDLQPPEKSATVTESPANAQISPCLPEGIHFDDLVLTETVGANQSPGKQLTVRMNLAQLKARCKQGKLIDRKGRQIRFYNLIGCWGNPPADYEAMLQNQAREIKRLKRRFTVIQIPCSQPIDPASIN
jgi:hypothetical protein